MSKRKWYMPLSLYVIFGLLALVGTWMAWRGGEDYIVAAIIGWAFFVSVPATEITQRLMSRSSQSHGH